ncbi:MAG: nucleotidyltransferase family protein [Kiloniellales bacterium]
MTAPVSVGMVLAAGLGTRLRPLTDEVPKPLLEVAGRPLIDWALDRLHAAGVAQVVVNTHYQAARIEAHLAGRVRPRIVISHEPQLLETGGGVKQALSHLGQGPFYVVNCDAIWTDGPRPALARLAAAWDDGAMDALMLLQPTADLSSYDGAGDYFLGPGLQARRRGERDVAPYLFTGIQLLHRRAFEGTPDGRFSLNLVYDRMQARRQLAAIVHDGAWFHAGTAEGLDLATAALTGHAVSVDRR